MKGEEREAFEALKRSSFLQVLFKCSRVMNEYCLERVRQLEGAGQVRPAHAALFPHIDFEGVRVGVLASRLGVTKQAVSQLLNDLEGWGLVERVPDPTDGRARLVRYSKEGSDRLVRGVGALKDIEEEFGVEVGKERMDEARVVLWEVLTRVEALMDQEKEGVE